MNTPAPIDVLAVLDDCYGALEPHERNIRADEFTEARAAVAELIDADREVDRVEAAVTALLFAGPRPHSYGTGWETRDAARKRELEAEREAAHKRRATALARVGAAP